MLYRSTGEAGYRDIALRVARQIMAYQTPAGWFTLGPRPEPGAGEPAAFAPFIYDVTAEFVLWLTLIAANVAANVARRSRPTSVSRAASRSFAPTPARHPR